MALRKGTQELKDLDVERVDGVDRPATGRSFMLFKSEDGADQIVKSYAMLATAADAVLKALRTDGDAAMSLKSAIVMNGLAQVLGQDAVFTEKSVPTQPYDISEPDVDTRGPADEKLGTNFVARSADMIGKAELKFKAGVGAKVKDADEDEDEDARKRKAKAAKDDSKDDGKPEPDEDDKPWMKKMTSTLETMVKAIAGQTAILKMITETDPEPVVKTEAEPFVVRRPASKQAPDVARVSKDDDGYVPRFGVRFAENVFGKASK